MAKTLVTGAAGFIGFHLCLRLLEEGQEVVGLDNLNGYYDVTLKEARLKRIEGKERFRFVRMDLVDRDALSALLDQERFEVIVNLAAQAGVRYSLLNPQSYVDNNITGFLNILEGCRRYPVNHLVFASSSSVYGANTWMPFSVHLPADHPVSLYGATKKANELMAHVYSDLFSIPSTGLRFFTVYGPWGRPDMALFLFTRAILDGRPIDVFNYGKMERDFTYIDDIVEGIVRIMKRIPVPDDHWDGRNPDPSSGRGPFKLYNIGNHRPVPLGNLIEILEDCLGKKARRNLVPMQAGDVPSTYADVEDLLKDVGFQPLTPIEEGVRRFVAWYREFYQV